MMRSNKPDVRNPLTRLPSAVAMSALPAEAKEALRALLQDMESDCRANAAKAWAKHKAPMAAYWKAQAVYARHARLLLGRP